MPRLDLIVPDWPAPACVRVLSTTRTGGASRNEWESFNLGMHCGDVPQAVAANRRVLRERLPADPCWLRQVHGRRVIHLSDWQPDIEADAAWTDVPGQVAAILTADCVPVVLAQCEGRFVAAAHAGWRGLAAGILTATVDALPAPAGEILAWIGPCIGVSAYEVGPEVPAAFIRSDAHAAGCFIPAADGRYRADLVGLARRQLTAAGVCAVSGGDWCTFSHPERFYSYRRDTRTGRMATVIWIDA